MCSSPAMPAIRAAALSKCYHLYDRPADRLRQLLWGRRRRYYREFWALRDASFEVARGEVLGVMGRNGAGKSTLLQLVCGTLAPNGGTIAVNGRVAALLELGAGFNPEFSGRENVIMAAAVLGLTRAETEARFEHIVDFSGIRDFIDQPVKFYSSGMYVRLAFAVATSVDPDILVIDEALSVGDGEFSRKSFDRIMSLKKAGVTILFCSHSLYQVEAFCDTALWLDHGRIMEAGDPAQVVKAYQASLDRAATAVAPSSAPGVSVSDAAPAPKGHARITSVIVSAAGIADKTLSVKSGKTDVSVALTFASDPALPAPTAAVTLHGPDGRAISSAGTLIDDVALTRDGAGCGDATLTFPRLPLLKGSYTVGVYLLCERGLHTYDSANPVATLEVSQSGLERGVVALPHRWQSPAQSEHGSGQ
jgi:lipopolysaccharide transport system ATP-binding protein